MFNQTEKLPVEVGDRVAVVRDGNVAKARVVEVLDGIGVFVTFAKGGEPAMYDRDAVMLLYRVVDTPKGKGAIPFIMGAPTKAL
jgi:hypothetical protein